MATDQAETNGDQVQPAKVHEGIVFKTDAATRRGECIAAAAFTVAFWLGAMLGPIMIMVFGGEPLGEYLAAVLAIAALVVILWAWLRWLWARLTFSVVLTPSGIGFGRWGARRPIPYGTVDMIMLSPKGVGEESRPHLVEIRAGWSRRRVFLGGRDRECGLLLFERCPNAVLIGEDGAEHFHLDTPKPLHGIAVLQKHRRWKGAIKLLGGLALLPWGGLLLALVVRALARGDEVTFYQLSNTVLIAGSALVLLVSGVIDLVKARRIGRKLAELKARGVTDSPPA